METVKTHHSGEEEKQVITRTSMNAPRTTKQAERMKALRAEQASATDGPTRAGWKAPIKDRMDGNSKMADGEHHDDEASPELLKSIAARLDAKLQKHAKGSWAKLFFVIDNDGSGRVEFHEFRDLMRNKATDTVNPGLEISKKEVSDDELSMLWDVPRRRQVGLRDRARAPIKDKLDKNSNFDDGAHHDDEASPEVLAAVARRLEARVRDVAAGSWAKLFFFVDNDGSGRVEFREFRDLIRNRTTDTVFPGLEMGRKEVSDDELSMLLATNSNFDAGTHADEAASPRLLRLVANMLEAAVGRRCKGSWAKLFFATDKNGSGRIEFDEFRALVRRTPGDALHPGLGVGRDAISDGELGQLWAAVDADRSGSVPAPEFKAARPRPRAPRRRDDDDYGDDDFDPEESAEVVDDDGVSAPSILSSLMALDDKRRSDKSAYAPAGDAKPPDDYGDDDFEDE
ncbi:hypothetical protein JL721_2369 [Aureococcus anophagefferens]|nr:hypothetical protein JL721_2369 [Aureococcus anophagefferens]